MSVVYKPEKPNYIGRQAHSNFTEHVIQSTCQFRPTLYLPHHCIHLFGHFVARVFFVSSGIFLHYTRDLELKFYMALALLEHSVAFLFSAVGPMFSVRRFIEKWKTVSGYIPQGN